MKLVRCSVFAGFCFLWAFAQNANAVSLLYDFEGDSGATVTDKATSDGTQNGAIYNSVDPADTSGPAFGVQSAFFDNPPSVTTPVPPWSTLQVPDTQFGPDFSLTLAAWVNHDFAVQRRVRVFSSFQGTGPVSDSILLDFSNTGATANVRGIVDGTSFTSPAIPAAGTAGYHHYAMTVGSGTMTLYFDGAQVMTGALPAGYVNSNSNLFIGEDPHNVGGFANEQLIGNVDEVLVLQRALSSTDIAQLALGNTVSSVVAPLASERAVYYDFEGDAGVSATDKFTLDGSQNGVNAVLSGVDSDPAHAKVGNTSYSFADPRTNDPRSGEELFSQINAGAVGSLGSQFTLSAVVNPYSAGQTGNGFARVFSSYSGGGSTAGQLLFDVNPIAVTGTAIRFYLPSNTGTATLTVPATTAKVDLDPLTNQTLTAVYDNGSLTLYLDGVQIGTATVAAGSQTLGEFDLRIGEDRGGYALAAANENFIGTMDDVMVLSRALTADQVAYLHVNGGVSLLASIPAVTGDYNSNGIVDAGDYTLWRDTLGQTGTGLAADGNENNMIDAGDYDLWKMNFGQTSGSGSLALNAGSAAHVPEPATLLLCCFIAGVVASANGASRRRH